MSTRFQTSQSNVWQIFASLQVLDPKKKIVPRPQKIQNDETRRLLDYKPSRRPFSLASYRLYSQSARMR